jgi:hypothetical protein
MLLQLARARQSERHPSDKQRALLFLSGVSLIGCRGLLSGISLVEVICSVTVFVSLARPVQHACSEPSLFALLHIKGLVVKLQPLVGRNPTKTKPKIQGFTPTDRWPAVRLFSTRTENTRPSDDFMNPITTAARIALLLTNRTNVRKAARGARHELRRISRCNRNFQWQRDHRRILYHCNSA